MTSYTFMNSYHHLRMFSGQTAASLRRNVEIFDILIVQVLDM